MIGWIVLAVYVLGYVFYWRPVAWFLANYMNGSDTWGQDLDGETLVLGIFMGSLATLLWPVIVVGAATKKIYQVRGVEITSLITPRSYRRRLELDERERRIAALERELNIR